MSANRVRNDGKLARGEKATTPPSWHNGVHHYVDDNGKPDPLPHLVDLIDPPSGLARVDPDKAAKRLERAAEHQGVHCQHPQHQPRLSQGPLYGYGKGRVVLHKRKPARPSGYALASPKSMKGQIERVLLGAQPRTRQT